MLRSRVFISNVIYHLNQMTLDKNNNNNNEESFFGGHWTQHGRSSSISGDRLCVSAQATASSGFRLHSAVIKSPQQFVNVKASHSSGRQLLLVESRQSFGSAPDDLPLAHTRHSQVPIRLVHVGLTPLEKFAHGNQQAWPAQVVVRRGEGLSLEQPHNTKHQAWRGFYVDNQPTKEKLQHWWK